MRFPPNTDIEVLNSALETLECLEYCYLEY